MKIAIAAILSSSIPLLCCPNLAAADESIVIDTVIDQIYAELARRRGLVLVAAPEMSDIQIGGIYYVSRPPCRERLGTWAGSKERLQIFMAAEPASSPPMVNKVRWITVRAANILGASAKASIAARIPNQAAEIDAAFSALEGTNAEFSYAVIEAPSLAIQSRVKAQLAENKIEKASDLSSEAVGLISPHAQLVVQNFTYDRRAAGGRSAGAKVNIVESIFAKLRASKDTREYYRFQNPTYAVAAIKPIPFLYPACTAEHD